MNAPTLGTHSAMTHINDSTFILPVALLTGVVVVVRVVDAFAP